VSRTEARRWLALGLAAFVLRACVAVLTEYKPLFPSYYYHDAVFVERIAWDMAETWRAGRAYQSPYSPPQRAHAILQAVPYALVGRHPLVNKLINALLGAAAAVLLGLAFRALVPFEAAFAASALVAAWPSHAFYTSQNFKEAPTLALAYAALALLLPALAPEAEPSPRRAAAAAVLLALAGLLRSYVLAVLALALALGAVLALRPKAGRAAAAFALAAALAATLLYRGAENLLFERLIPVPPGLSESLPQAANIAAPPGPAPAAWTPAGIGLRRAQGQASDRAYAEKALGREVATQIEPDARLETWLDLARFLPRAGFQVLFMPLPGLYPMDGKLGRWLAALENVVLLGLAFFAAFGLARAPLSPGRAVALSFFLAMAAGSALMEFDLGSASRHKLLYLPMLFPFAAEELLRRRRA
jgi:hypothetical protein